MKSDGRLACRHSCLAVVDMQLRVYVCTVHVATTCTFVCMCKTLFSKGKIDSQCNRTRHDCGIITT